MRDKLKYPTGTKQLYSDIGFMLLGHIAEILTGANLDRAAMRYIFQPLGMKSTSYIDLSMIKRRGIHPVTDIIAPTEECSWRKRVLCGEVHDDNAWVMGGVAGHSGVFSTAQDLHLFATEIIDCWRGSSDFVKRQTLETFWSKADAKGDSAWLLGWDSPSAENSMLEAGLSERAVGINGFSGCSLWLEPDRGIDIVLMSIRIHPNRSNKKIVSFRPELHHAIMQAFAAKPVKD
jgi:CubicO group peptidase (beta-lactamase class C family)